MDLLIGIDASGMIPSRPLNVDKQVRFPPKCLVMQPPRQMKKWFIITAVLFALLVLGAISVVTRFMPSDNARKAWKDKSLTELLYVVADPMAVSNRASQLKLADNGDEDSGWWISDRLILLQNGDWLAYASICQKQDNRIRDLFLARGSEGLWYYSTYHFCKGMIVLRMDGQPKDLPSFIERYYLRQFDGHSEECLQTTWPVKRR